MNAFQKKSEEQFPHLNDYRISTMRSGFFTLPSRVTTGNNDKHFCYPAWLNVMSYKVVLFKHTPTLMKLYSALIFADVTTEALHVCHSK